MKKSKVVKTFVGKIPLPSISEQVRQALKEQSPNYPQSVTNQLDIPDADTGIYNGVVKYLAQNNIYLTKKQTLFYSQHEWHNVAAAIFQVTQDFNGLLFANKIIYITQMIIQHSAIIGSSAGDFIALRQESVTGEKWLYYLIDIASTQKEPLNILFNTPLRLTDYYYLDRPLIGAAEYFELQIYGWIEDK